MTEIPCNKGLHYWEYDVVEDDIPEEIIKKIADAHEENLKILSSDIDYFTPDLIACRHSLPLGFDAEDLPEGAVLRKR